MSDTAKIHPDELMKMLCNLAKAHGYGVTELELIGLEPVGLARPEHRYSAKSAEPTSMPSEKKAAHKIEIASPEQEVVTVHL